MVVTNARPHLPASRRSSYVVRSFEKTDAPSLCDLLETCDWGPYRDGHGFGPDDLLRGLEENGTLELFVGVWGADQIIGCVALVPVSSQRGPRGHSVFGDLLVVHPSFRGYTGLAAALMEEAGTAAFASGYDRIDTHIEVGNERAERMYRRLHFRQVTNEPCEDGSLLFESHLPLIVRYLITTFWSSQYRVRDWLIDPKALRRLLPRPEQQSGVDVPLPWFGSEVVVYELRLNPAEHLVLMIDRAIDRVTAVGGERQDFACWPEGGRSFRSGGEVTIHFRMRSGYDHPGPRRPESGKRRHGVRRCPRRRGRADRNPLGAGVDPGPAPRRAHVAADRSGQLLAAPMRVGHHLVRRSPRARPRRASIHPRSRWLDGTGIRGGMHDRRRHR
jgi:GNAT superfamily N-acetyltransferase